MKARGASTSRRLWPLIALALVIPLLLPLLSASLRKPAWHSRGRPLRRVAKGRLMGNLILAGLGLVSTQRLQAWAERRLVANTRGRGLLGRARLPAGLEPVLFVLLMDYGMYHWHKLTHRHSLLWRFHRVHHADRSLDVTTALRFHPGELLLALPWRLGCIWLLRPSAPALKLWERLFFISVLFHHANLNLPPAVDKLLSRLIVTPRLHGIHHSNQAADTHSNFSAGLALWDRLHGSYRARAASGGIVTGSPDGPSAELDPLQLLGLPFGRRP